MRARWLDGICAYAASRRHSRGACRAYILETAANGDIRVAIEDAVVIAPRAAVMHILFAAYFGFLFGDF